VRAAASIALTGLLLACPAARAQEQPVQAATRAAGPDVEAGLRWLASKQSATSGSWGNNNKLAVTGMAGLALLASGSTPQRGPYAASIRRAVQFVLRSQRAEEGRRKAFWDPSNGYSAIHNHGYALLFLTQAYGEGGPLDDELRQAITRGVQATVESQYTPAQGKSDGGFGYFLFHHIPRAHQHMWRWDEASTTISQIQALRGARNAGFTVPRRALERAGDYIARSRHEATGGFHYSIGSTPPRVSFVEGSDEPTFAITAACTAVLHALGTYQGPVVESGIAYMERSAPPTAGKKVPFYYYAHYYAAQVFHMLPGPRGQRWLQAIRAELSERQRPDGRWPNDPEDTLAEEDSELLNTAWALQVCLIDRGTLPLHER